MSEHEDRTAAHTDRIADLELWIGEGFSIRVAPPSRAGQAFVANIPEIGLATRGQTEDEAIAGMFSTIEQVIANFLNDGIPLPVRHDAPSSSNDATALSDG